MSEAGSPRILVAIGLLAVLGAGTVLFVLLRSRECSLRPRSIVCGLFSALWLLPAVAAAGYVLAVSVPHLRSQAAKVPSHEESLRRLMPEDDSVDTRVHVAAETGRTLEVRSRPWPTPEEAVRDARRRAAALIEHALRPQYAYDLGTIVRPNILEKSIAGQSVARTDHNTETQSFQMHVAYLTLDLSPSVREAYAEAWQARLVDVRMVVLGGLVALAIVIVTAAAAYFRLDLATNGVYRLQLKLAAVSLIVAGGLALAQILPGSHAPPTPPSAKPSESIATVQ
ncbi:MAG TPA: hypothetical protein VML55_08195 [Planctomycetaceae bacterium]|nr:hypothetical protein [Planctomycetaceae bacterium]